MQRNGGKMRFEEHVSTLLSAVIAVEYMDYSFPKKYKGCKRWLYFIAGIAMYFLVLTGFGVREKFEGVMGFVYGVAVIGYGLAALRGKPGNIIFQGILWMLITIIGTYMAYGVLGIMRGSGLRTLVENSSQLRRFVWLSAAALKFAMGRIVIGISRKRGELRKTEDWLIAAAFLLMFLLAHGMFYLEIGIADQEARYRLTIFLLGGMFGLILLIEMSYRKLWKYREENLELRYQREQELSQWENIQALYQVGREVNRARHDMGGRLDVLYGLLKKQKYEEARGYIENLRDGLSGYPELPKETGNIGLNAALLKAKQECRGKGIRFHYVILGKPEQIDSMDMATLLYNLFSNGIEACDEVKGEKELSLVLREQKGETELQVENTVAYSVFKENPRMESRKPEKEQHGLGMESIRRIIEKYHGDYVCREEDENFIQVIRLMHLE